MAKENTLWPWLRRAKRHYGKRLLFQRIESKSIEAGIPDLFICCDGISFWVEGKTTSELSADQHKWHREYQEAGGISFIYSLDKNNLKYIERYGFPEINRVFIVPTNAIAYMVGIVHQIQLQRITE